MTLFYFDIRTSTVRRSGKSTMARAANESGEELVDGPGGVPTSAEHDRPHVAHTEILAPDGAPAWAYERERLWNAAEAAERNRNAVFAMALTLGAPPGLTLEQQVELARAFVREQFVGRGMVADLAIHRVGAWETSLHVMVTKRALEGEGFASSKPNNWAPGALAHWRQAWARAVDAALARVVSPERDARAREGTRRDPKPENARLEPELAMVLPNAANRLNELADKAYADFLRGEARYLSEGYANFERLRARLYTRGGPRRRPQQSGVQLAVGGLPKQPTSGDRREALLAATESPSRSGLPTLHRETLERFDRMVASIRHYVLDNPAWRFSEDLFANPPFEIVHVHLARNRTLARAREQRDQAASELERLQRALPLPDSRPSWQRTLKSLVAGPESEDLAREVEAARVALGRAERGLADTESEVRRKLERDVAALNKRLNWNLRARLENQQVLEAPLRLAVLERYAVEQALLERKVVLDFEETPRNTLLTFDCAYAMGGFAYHEFRDDQGRRFLANPEEAAWVANSPMGLARGDRVVVPSFFEDGDEFVVAGRYDTWPIAATVEGRVVEIDRDRDVFRGIKVTRGAMHASWVRPRSGDDLASDFSVSVLRDLQVGDEIRITPGNDERIVGLPTLSLDLSRSLLRGHGR